MKLSLDGDGVTCIRGIEGVIEASPFNNTNEFTRFDYTLNERESVCFIV